MPNLHLMPLLVPSKLACCFKIWPLDIETLWNVEGDDGVMSLKERTSIDFFAPWGVAKNGNTEFD